MDKMDNNNIKAGMTCDMRILAQILGQRTYSNNVLQVAVKELLQNSYDACKPLRRGEVLISMGSGKNPKTGEEGHYLKVADNGIGMTTETVLNVYLRMGGTLKEGLADHEKSGGFGIAKIQYLTQSEATEIVSWRDGVETRICTTSEELFSSSTEVHTVTTDHANGTEITVWYPRNVDVNWPFASYPSRFGLDKPCLGYPDIHVWYKAPYEQPLEVCIIDPKIYTAQTQLSFDWGDIDVYYAPQEYRASNYPYPATVMSAGLFQFNANFNDSVGTGLKFRSILNIKSKVDAHDLKYPINNSREGFSPSVAEDIEVLQKYLFDIQKCLNAELVRQFLEDSTSLPYVSVDETLSENVTLRPAAVPTLSQEFLLSLVKAFSECSTVYEEKEMVKKAEVTIAHSKTKSEADSKDMMQLLNKTDASYTAGATEVASKVSSIIEDVLSSKLFGDNILAGVLIKKRTAGMFVKSDYRRILINPFAYSLTNGELWVHLMMNSLVHELAHINITYHGEEHNSAMDDVTIALYDHDLWTPTEAKFRTIWSEYKETICENARRLEQAHNVTLD